VDYNVTVELDGQHDPEELAERLYGTEPADAFHLAIHKSSAGSRAALTLTVGEWNVHAAIDAALEVTRDAWELNPYAVAALPTDEYDRRVELGVDVPSMVSVPDAAAMLGVSPQRVRQLLAAEQLAGRKVGRDWLVSRVAVQRRLAA
jgi:hypothetical protein